MMITYKDFKELYKSSKREDREALEIFKEKYPSMYDYYEGIVKVGV